MLYSYIFFIFFRAIYLFSFLSILYNILMPVDFFDSVTEVLPIARASIRNCIHTGARFLGPS